MTPAQKICEYLESAFAADPGAVSAILFDRTAQCNKTLADHPTVQVRAPKDGDAFVVSPMGVITGMLLTLGDEVVVGVFTDDDLLTGFQVRPKSDVGL